MKILVVLLFSILSFSNDYNFPRVEGLRATVAGSLFKTPKNRKYKSFWLRPDQQQKNTRNKLFVRYYPADQNEEKFKNSLVFVLAGIGGDGKGNIANLLANRLSAEGYEVAIIPSVFTKQFALSFSSTGYVGDLKTDSQDLFHGLYWVKKKLIKKFGIQFKSVHLVGYSLGALTAAHVAAFAERMEHIMPFKRVLLLNTPVDLLYGLRFLDTAQREAPSLNLFSVLFGKFKVLRKILKYFSKTKFVTLEIFKKSIEELQALEDIEVKGLIAAALKTSLRSVILASQRVVDLGVLSEKTHLDDPVYIRHAAKKKRYREAGRLSFEDYISGLLVPFYNDRFDSSRYDLDLANYRSSLYSVEDFLKRCTNTYLFHNEDDFLLRGEEDVDYLKRVFGLRQKFYPVGGHLGNIWFEQNIKDIINIMVVADRS